MKTSYKPSKLPAIAAQVRKEHPTSSEIRNYQLDNGFLDEVRQTTQRRCRWRGHHNSDSKSTASCQLCTSQFSAPSPPQLDKDSISARK